MLIACLFQTSVTFPAIGMHYTPGLNRFLYERLQTPRKRILNSTHAYSANTTAIFLGRNDDQSFLLLLAPTKPFFFLLNGV